MPDFVKRHPDAATAAEAIRRAAALRAAGVPTPAARPGGADREVAFDLVDGISGRALLDRDPAALLAPLARLHRARVSGLPRYDPFLRSRPRLTPATNRVFHEVLAEPVPGGSATLHGDFHAGQLIEAQDGVWIVDLDDMALGPPEADLANFTAHVATSGDACGFADRLTTWREAVVSAYGSPCRAEVFARYLRFALVRRHLKLRAAGRTDFETEIAVVLTGATDRISPSGSAGYRG